MSKQVKSREQRQRTKARIEARNARRFGNGNTNASALFYVSHDDKSLAKSFNRAHNRAVKIEQAFQTAVRAASDPDTSSQPGQT